MSLRPTYCPRVEQSPCRRSYCICIELRDCTGESTRERHPD